MMTSTFSRLAACAFALLAGTSANAYEVTAGQITLGYSGFTGDVDVLSKQSIGSSIEFAFADGWGAQGDFSYQDTDESNFDSIAFSLHGFYHVNSDHALGFFVGNERLDFDGDTDNVGFRGVEVNSVFDQTTVEAYYTDFDHDVEGYGLDAEYDFQNGFYIGASYDEINDVIDQYAVRVSYELTDRVVGTFEIGSADFDGELEQDFFAFTVDYNFGRKHKPTFNKRGFLEQIPGL